MADQMNVSFVIFVPLVMYYLVDRNIVHSFGTLIIWFGHDQVLGYVLKSVIFSPVPASSFLQLQYYVDLQVYGSMFFWSSFPDQVHFSVSVA